MCYNITMKTYIVGNWKMNFTVGEASLFLHRLLHKIQPSRNTQVIVAPSTLALQPLSLQIDRRRMKLAAQNVCPHDYGAYTGEVSVAQLRSLVDYAIIGHSERRTLFHETCHDIRDKASACIRAGISPIICIGETFEERKNDETADESIVDGLSPAWLPRYAHPLGDKLRIPRSQIFAA